MLYHGLKLLPDEKGEFHFGIVSLMVFCLPMVWLNIPPEERPQEFLKRFNKRSYLQRVQKSKDTIWKIHTAIRYLSNYITIAKNEENYAFDGAPIEKAAIYFNAIDDIPYHFDSLISYTRILVDCISSTIPYFYETKTHIVSEGFRQQKKWFLKNRLFDSEYTSILSSKTAWFDVLAGKKPKGYRDILFHQFATYQTGKIRYPNGKYKLIISLVTADGFATSDLIQSITNLLSDFFSYLDDTYKLFGNRILQEINMNVPGKLEDMSIINGFSGNKNLQQDYRFYPLIE